MEPQNSETPNNITQSTIGTAQEDTATVVTETKHEHHSTALEVVLQWLTYSFWFWTLALTCTILGAMLAYFIGDAKELDWVTYTIGPIIVLFFASYFADKYYRRIEPIKKHGFSAVVMVINAVIACLIGIGSLITALVTATTMLVDPGDTNIKTITLLTSLIVAILTLLFFIRIIYVEKLRFVREKFWLIMSIVITIALVLTILGPFINSIQRRTDTLIENNYRDITREISDFVNDNDRLPDTLDEVSFEDGAKEAVDTGRISYEKKTTTNNLRGSTGTGVDLSNPYRLNTFNSNRQQFEYKLCVEWQHEKESYYYSTRRTNYFDGSHEAGKQCYDETVYNYNY